jgi:hypothetical protein
VRHQSTKWEKDSTSTTIHGKIKPPFEGEGENDYEYDTDRPFVTPHACGA